MEYPEQPTREQPFMASAYGFRVNISNPYIYGLYVRYKKKHSIPLHYPPEDAQRLEFELAVIPYLEKRFGVKAPPPNIPTRIASRIPMELIKAIYGYDRLTALDIKTQTEEAEAESNNTEESTKK